MSSARFFWRLVVVGPATRWGNIHRSQVAPNHLIPLRNIGYIRPKSENHSLPPRQWD